MKSIPSFCIIILTIAGFACTNETNNDNSENKNNDIPVYTVGQKCPKEITYNGICDDNKAVFCNKKGVVEEDICPNRCMIKKAYTEPFAECYYECGNVDFKGECVGGGYDYCNETEGLIHITCDSGKTCGLKDDVYSCI